MSRRKYERYLNPISRTPFSTAGTHRNQGRVGQTSLSRTLVRTTYIPRTKVPVGQGGNGSGDQNIIVNSCCKGSHSEGQTSMTTKGMILSRITNPTAVYNAACEKPGACNKITVKNFDPAVHSNEMLLRRARAKNIQNNGNKLTGEPALYKDYRYSCNSCGPGGTSVEHYIGSRKFTNEPYAKRVAPISVGEYLQTQLYAKRATEKCCDNENPSGAISVDTWIENGKPKKCARECRPGLSDED